MRLVPLSLSLVIAVVVATPLAHSAPAVPRPAPGIVWELIESAKLRADGCDAVVATVTEALSLRPANEIREFRDELQSLMVDSYRWDLWAVVYVANGGASDEGFESFRAWLVLRGREVFAAAMADPVSAIQGIDREESMGCGSLVDVPKDAFRRAAGAHLEPSALKYPPAPAGTAWNEETLEREYPELVARVRALRPGAGGE